MHSILKSLFVAAVVSAGLIQAQSTDFTVEGKPVQIHGFASQAFLASDNNNYLTMPTSQGSFAFTDFGGNISLQLTGKFRVGAQFYDLNLGQLGGWHPQLDWASGDYRFRDWFGVRVGKIKTVLGLYNDTQDLESLHTWAILPQSMYPLDLRTSIAHVGGDFYGDISLKRMGTLSYTAWAGSLPNDPNGGYVYGAEAYGLDIKSLVAHAEGGDLRWNTPLPGLLMGLSYMSAAEHLRGTDVLGFPFTARSKKYDLPQFYLQYALRDLKFDAEYRRTYVDQLTFDALSPLETILDSRSFYGSASYRISKRIEIGTYYSRFYLNWGQRHSNPDNHVFDKVASLRVDLTNHWDLKIEGHFVNGYGASDAYRGFYWQVNPRGLKPNTDLLVIRTGIQF